MDIFIIPIITGIFAWFIAWLFIKILTSSKRFGLKKIIQQIDISVFLNATNSAQHFETVLPIIDKQLDDFFKHKLGEKMPAIAMFIGDKTIEQLKAVFVEELRAISPSMIQKIAYNGKENFEKNLDSKWLPILETKLMNITRPYRYLAFAIGIVFGILLIMLSHHL